MTTSTRLLTFAEAADLLHVEGADRLRRTRRLLLRLEGQTNGQFLVRFEGSTTGTRYRVSLPHLRRAVPAFFEVEQMPEPLGPEPPAARDPDEIEDIREGVRDWMREHRDLHDRGDERLDELASQIRHVASVADARLLQLERAQARRGRKAPDRDGSG